MADEGQFLGLSADAAQAAKVAAAGGFGSGVLVYLRHPGTIVRAGLLVAIGVGIASIFAEPFSSLTGLSVVQAGALLGLVGKGIAEGFLRAIEKMDFSAWLPGKK